MAHYDTYQSNAAEAPLMRKWLLRALVISLLLHGGLILFFNVKKLENFGYESDERLAPPVRVQTRAVIVPPEMTDEETKLTLPVEQPKAQIVPPKDMPMPDELVIAPSAPATTAPLVQEKVKVDLTGFEAQDNKERDSMAALEKQLRGVAGSMVEKSIAAKNQPRITVPAGNKRGDGIASSGVPGRASIDEALANAVGPVAGKPIAMQGGALFEHAKAELLPQAVENLAKLGELIKRNPKATFIISGHTDHPGTYEGNVILSQQRADAVRDWLVLQLGIDPARITTIGKADDEAFPNLGPEKSIEEQGPNRRVEIVIKTNRK